jgi:ABC-2 type transport system permease protein
MTGMQWLKNVLVLAGKELRSFFSDRLLLAFLLLSFTFMIYSEATGVETEVQNANVAVVDGDHSVLSRRFRDALRLPYFRPPVVIDRSVVDAEMDRGRFTFVLDLPPHFEADILRGRRPMLQLNIDATAMTQAGVGAGYIEAILQTETERFLQQRGIEAALPVAAITRALFNPNLDGFWYQAVNSMIENITIFALLLVGAAVIRERERGTLEHLLVMPLLPSEIAAAKVLANGLIVLLATTIALVFTLGMLLEVPLRGSLPLFLLATGTYVFAIMSLGIMLATIANTMPQFGLLAMPVFLILSMLSGATSPLESMPPVLQILLQASPTVHFVKLSQAVLFRNAGLGLMWPQLLAMSGLGALFLLFALSRFRTMLANQG